MILVGRYVLPVLVCSLEVILPNRTLTDKLERVYRRFLKQILSLPETVADPASYSQRKEKSAFFSAKREKSKHEIDNFSEKQQEKEEILRQNFSAFRSKIFRRIAAKTVIMT